MPQRAKSPPERKYPAEGATPAAAPIDVREVNWSRLAGCWEDTGNQGKASAHTQKTEGLKSGYPLFKCGAFTSIAKYLDGRAKTVVYFDPDVLLQE